MAQPEPMPGNILVYVGGDLVGDGVMKLPFLRALRQAYPDARIAWMAGKHKSAYAHELAPLIDGLLDEVIEQAGIDRTARWLVRRPLPDRYFDLIIDTQRGVLASLILRRVRHGRFISGAAEFLLSDVRPPKPYHRPAAMVRQMLDLLALATGREPAPGAPPKPAPDDRFAAAAAEILPAGPAYVGIAPGAGGRQKCWPLANFIAVARAQAGRGRVPVFILGPGEEEWIAALAEAVPDALFPASDGNGGKGISRSALFTIRVASRLAAAVANDSGAGHMIAAADAPLVSLFGPTPPDKFAPTATRLTVLRAQDFGGGDMAAIPIEAVTEAVDKMLA
jgi:ADP-heptose:LPS heptosyltransferase